MVPYYAGRVEGFVKAAQREAAVLTRAPLDYFRMFYNDLAIHGNLAGLMCAYAFFGAERLLFGTDFPLGDTEFGERNYRETISAVERMDITEAERQMIFAGNARDLLRLTL